MHGFTSAGEFNTYCLHKRDGTQTSVRLEPEILSALRYLAFVQGISIQEVMRRVDALPRPMKQNFSSAIRCYVIRTLMQLVLDLLAPKRKR
jgi:predicted DNA-binding ribbon-helix-helix protein